MRLLLDTHIALWAVVDDGRLGGKANDMPVSAQEALGYFRDAGFALLDIASAHTVEVERLPMLHADPFDRLLVAQAITVPLRLLTHDARVAQYSDTVIVV